MTTQTLTRRSTLTGDVPPIVLQVQDRGDILRKVRSLHPEGHRIDSIADAEAAVAETTRLLENLIREHQRQVDRLNVLRSRQGLPALPASDGHPAPQVGAEVGMIGRVTEHAPLTAKGFTIGTFRLTSDEEVRWTASASLVDALDPLFSGVPVEITAILASDGTYTLNQIKAAPMPFWESAEDYARYAEIGPVTLMTGGLLKKELRQKSGKCRLCRSQLPKWANCSLIDSSNGVRIVCRSCKQQWIDAGRPEVEV
ncbi:hypothetical protein AB0F30_33365 [Streptomyces sp. NPDC029006]|uniref:hypothetical protein n=1 Tax=Streptomyces sp. NPDC029006 TaxID=3155467 RepID=UPI0033CF376B